MRSSTYALSKHYRATIDEVFLRKWNRDKLRRIKEQIERDNNSYHLNWYRRFWTRYGRSYGFGENEAYSILMVLRSGYFPDLNEREIDEMERYFVDLLPYIRASSSEYGRKNMIPYLLVLQNYCQYVNRPDLAAFVIRPSERPSHKEKRCGDILANALAKQSIEQSQYVALSKTFDQLCTE
jgi:hypothetical protein